MTTFKIHFAKENIRKVTLDTSLDYISFITFLNENYAKHLINESFSLQYYDQDNDLITVSSQIEWEELMSGDQRVISVFVKRDSAVREDVVSLKGLFEMLRGNRCQRFNRGFHQHGLRRRQFTSCFNEALRLMENEGDRESLEVARDLFLRALRVVPGHPVALYNVACVESLLGNIEQAIHVLRVAIDAGWNDVSHTINDSDFDNIRNTEGFEECIRVLSGDINDDNDESSEDVSVEYDCEDMVLPFETTFEKPEETKTEDLIPQTDENKQEAEDPMTEMHNLLAQIGFEIEPSVLETLVAKYGTDLTQIINHYLNYY